MTQITRLLSQNQALCQAAVEQTGDVNEAYLVVHGVMAHAFDCDEGSAPDLAVALMSALQRRAPRNACPAAQ